MSVILDTLIFRRFWRTESCKSCKYLEVCLVVVLRGTYKVRLCLLEVKLRRKLWRMQWARPAPFMQSWLNKYSLGHLHTSAELSDACLYYWQIIGVSPVWFPLPYCSTAPGPNAIAHHWPHQEWMVPPLWSSPLQQQQKRIGVSVSATPLNPALQHSVTFIGRRMQLPYFLMEELGILSREAVNSPSLLFLLWCTNTKTASYIFWWTVLFSVMLSAECIGVV